VIKNTEKLLMDEEYAKEISIMEQEKID